MLDTIKKIILNKGLFYGSLIALTILVIILLSFGNCCSNPKEEKLTVTDITMYPLDRGTVSFPLDFYVVKSNFTNNQFNILNKAAKEIETILKIPKINLIPYDPPTNFSEETYLIFDRKTFWKMSGLNEEVLKLQIKHGICASAVSKGDFILIFDDFGNLDDEYLFIAAKHEILHQLGMEHIYPQYPALMNVGANKGIITEFDKMQFCFLYKC